MYLKPILQFNCNGNISLWVLGYYFLFCRKCPVKMVFHEIYVKYPSESDWEGVKGGS